jgi:hypothetical protein
MSKYFQYNTGPLMNGASPKDVAYSNAYELGVYLAETTQRFAYGTRFITWDGRVYKYSLAGAAVYTHRLNVFYNTISSDANGIDYSLLTNAQAAGDTEITLTNGTTAIAEDYLAGGLAIIVPTEGATDREVMARIVVGNDAAAAAAECTMYLESPLETAVTTSNYAYVMPSSYSNIRYESTSGYKSFAGLAATYAAAAYKFWCQTYGVAQSAQQTTYVGKVAYYRAVYARHDGTLDTQANTVESGGTVVTDQCVGFGLDNNADQNGTTNWMMTISY